MSIGDGKRKKSHEGKEAQVLLQEIHRVQGPHGAKWPVRHQEIQTEQMPKRDR